MKLIIILITFTVQVSVAAYAQQISLSFKNSPLKEVMQALRKQTGYSFMLSTENLKLAKPVTVNIKSTSIEETLHAIFADQPFTYKVEGKVIMIRERVAEKKFEPALGEQQVKDLRGTVLDQDGKPLEGATVIIKETGKVAITNRAGEFLFANGPENGTLMVRMIGHETKEYKFQNSLVPTVTLKEVNADLAEIQIIAYGTQEKKFSTNTIVTIGAKEIAQQPVSNPLLALQGRVPGLFIEQSSGVSGAGVNVTIQGTNSLQSGNNPFYVIDGIPYSSEFTGYSLGVNAFNGSGSAFSFLNPSDIESISILKDADATAIYGSRAANGAILITTKKGKAGKTKIDVNVQNGWGSIDRRLKLLNTKQYLEMRKEAYANDGLPVPTSTSTPASSNFDLTVWNQDRYTDWQKVLVGGTGQFTEANISLSGGAAGTQFLIGYGYNRQTGVYPNSLADLKANLHFNLNHSSNDNKLKYSLSATYLKDKNQLNTMDLMDIAITLPPNAPELYGTDGTLNWEPYPNNPSRYSFQNPLANTKTTFTGKTTNITANNTISYELIPDLLAKVSLGYNDLRGNETTIVPITSFKPDRIRSRSANYLTKSTDSWIIEPQLTYTKNTNIGVIDALLGGTIQQSKTDVLGQAGSGYTDDSQLLNILAASTVNVTTVFKSIYKYNAIFARLNYRLKDKYILNFTARRDGSSRFGDANKQHTFYAIGGAWLFRDEDFIKKNLSWLSSGKLRANYGITGNDQIPDYTYQSLLETYRVDLPYQGGTGIYPTSIYNPYLQWEETRKLNIGLNLAVLNDRIQLDFNYFRNRSSNQLVSYILPTTTGFPGITENFDAVVQNTGIEILLSSSIIKSKSFNWQSSLNFTNPKNKLVAFPGLETSTYANQYVIGEPINIIKAFKFAGVNENTGLYQFLGHDGKITSSPNPSIDQIALISQNPKWYGGLVNNIQYKAFSLDFTIQFVKQMAAGYRFGLLPGSASGSVTGNQPVEVLDRWRVPGDVSNVQMFSSNASQTFLPATYASQSDINYNGASYTRLKNASLSYSLPEKWLNKIHFSNARLYMQGQNLITISNFIGTDPETKARTVLPPMRVYTLGLQIGL